MVGIVGTVSVSLIAATPSNAQAFDGADLLQKEAPRIIGGVKTLAPAAVAVATSVTPTGWALKAAWSLGMLALNTSDIWMPYVVGAFGAAKDLATQPGSTTTTHAPYYNGFDLTTVTNKTTYVNVGGYYGGSGVDLRNGTTVAVMVKMTCKKADGTLNTRNLSKLMAFGDGTGAYGRTTAASFDCPDTSYTPVGLKAGAWGADSDLGSPCPGGTGDCAKSGPQNVITWGTLSADKGFDPKAANVGYQGRSECVDSLGNKTWIDGQVIAGDQGGVKMPSCSAAGKGIGTGRNQVVAFKPDGTKETVWDMPTAPSDPSTPLCEPGTTSSGCTLEVLKNDQPCIVGDPECENWESEQQKDPTKWKCKFGPYNLPLSACNLLERGYRIGGGLATEKNTDGDPATQDNTNLAGQPVPQPAPGPVTGTGPGTGPGGQPAPGQQGQTTPSSDPSSKKCYPQGWAAFNPVEWVLKPVGCALEAAFVPSQQVVQAQSTRIQGRINQAGPGKVIAAWQSTFEGMGGGGGGCQGPAIQFSMEGYNQTMRPFAACEGGMATAASISYAVSSVMIVVVGGLGIARAVASAFGFNFTLGKGGSEA